MLFGISHVLDDSKNYSNKMRNKKYNLGNFLDSKFVQRTRTYQGF